MVDKESDTHIIIKYFETEQPSKLPHTATKHWTV